MTESSCDVCIDLMPLIKDNVASSDSESLVKEHIQSCQSCRSLYDTFTTDIPIMNDKKVITKIRRQIFMFTMGVIAVAAVLGVALTEGMGMFYNILIMPSIGVVGYFVLNKKAYLTPIALFIFSYIWLFIKYVLEGMLEQGFIIASLVSPMVWSLIYVTLCAAGVVIGALLKFAFRKEVEN